MKLGKNRSPWSPMIQDDALLGAVIIIVISNPGVEVDDGGCCFH